MCQPVSRPDYAYLAIAITNLTQALPTKWKPTTYSGAIFLLRGLAFFRLTGELRRILPQSLYADIHRAFVRNPLKYPDPDSFRPERWLEPGWPTYQEPLTHFPTIKGMTSFGWGQRQCLGQTLTQDELIVACGALSWGFNLRPKKDPATGRNLPVPLDKSNSLLIIKPDPFQMTFEPRSETRKREALQLWAESDAQDQRERYTFAKQATQAPGKLGTKI
jgi:hypothetical protein